MSVATEFAPTVYLPPQTRLRDEQLATVLTLYRPSERSIVVPVRLTRRGVHALTAAVALLVLSLVWVAWLSAPSATAGRSATPAAVTVHGGDTLWSIATRIAPNRDPRAEVADLRRINHLSGVDLAAGQVLRTR